MTRAILQASAACLPVAQQIRLLTRAIELIDPGDVRDEMIERRRSLRARRDRLIASRMTALLAGRPRGFVAPIRQPEART